MELLNNSEHTRMGDSLHIDISYYNFSDTIVEFYPQGYIIISRANMIFSENQTLPINEIIDYRGCKKIFPKKKYLVHYGLKIERPFFHEGVNELMVDYRIKKNKEVNNKFCGTLSTNIFQIKIEK